MARDRSALAWHLLHKGGRVTYFRSDMATIGRKGYTLAEIMLVVVILGVMSALAIIKMSPGLGHSKVDRAATVLATDLQYAQQLAVKQRAPIVFAVDSSAKSYTIKDRATSTVYRTVKLGSTSSYTLDQLTQSPGTAILFPNGAAAQTTTFTLGLGGYTQTVRITLAGQVRIP
jgi:type II secretion system protein H